MAASWQADHQWARRFIPEIKAILGMHLIGEASVEDDQQRATDLMVLRSETARTGCRIRRYEHYARYGGEITIRSGRASGMKTELPKIIEGWGNYIFYGFSNSSEDHLHAWVLGSLNVFRLWFNRQLALNRGVIPGVEKKNADGHSSFMAFRINEMPTEFVVARCEA